MGQEQTRVVVTGIGALTPIGHTKEAFWDALMKGTSGGAPITYFDATDFATTFACELKNFSVEDYIEKRTADRMDPYCQYAIVSSDQALKDSGLDLEAIDLSESALSTAPALAA